MVIGYLAAGILVGPYLFPFDLITDIDTVNSLANLGIILLMFTIGLEFNLRKLRQTGLFAIVAGTIEIVIMITIGYALGWADGMVRASNRSSSARSCRSPRPRSSSRC